VRVARALLAILLFAVTAPAGAHRVDPEQVMASIRSAPEHSGLGVIDVHTHPGVPRLLVIEVDERWLGVDPERRRRAAEAWRGLWRESTPQGVLAVTDSSGTSLVGFDGEGHATLHPVARRGEHP
jgi:hypothetical protein